METKKRRGGRRMRSLKEKFSESEMLKQANRRGFSVETGEYGDDAMGLTLGMLEKTKDGSGNIRHLAGSVGDKRKMKQSNTKIARKKAAAMNSGRGQSNGLATSVIFTPVQGLELVNPDAARENVKMANKKWFSENSGFKSALPK
jgi:U4/U6 small nuclear ribonucleoprotein PRP31